MKLGLIYDLRNPERWRRPWPQHYAEFLDRIVELERLGFEEVALPEHHFHPDGYLPSPIPMMAALAVKTNRIRIASDLFVLPNHHPVRLGYQGGFAPPSATGGPPVNRPRLGGSVQQLIDEIMRVKEIGQYDDFPCGVLFGGPGCTWEEEQEQMHAFADEIMPVLTRECGGTPELPVPDIEW